MTGRLVAGYRLDRKIGEGGMGTVYEGVHQSIGRRAAVKLLAPELARDAEIIDRFFNEARAVNIARHPDIVSISELGQLSDGTAYLVMEYLDGETLSARLSRLHRLPLSDALRLSRQIASALVAAHDKGVVHRDLKPDNVMIVADAESLSGERAKLLDFGIAKLAAEHQRLSPNKVRTRAGLVLGTPVYMSPEQCRGADQVDAKTDVYSLGIMLYQMLAGHPPFVTEAEGELMAAHIYEEPVPLSEVLPGTPAGLSDLLQQMLDKDRTLRPTMSQVVAWLAEAEAPGTPRVSGPLSIVSASPSPPSSPALAPRVTPPPMPVLLSTTRPPEEKSPGRLPVYAALGLVGLLGLSAAVWGLRHGASIVPRWPGLAAAHVPPRQQDDRGQPGVVPSPPSPSPPGPPLMPAPLKVRWSLITDPAGADVVRLTDGVVLAQTPFNSVRLAESGTMTVALRRRGFVEKHIDLDLSANVIVHERLAALPPPFSPATWLRLRRPERSHGAPAVKQVAEAGAALPAGNQQPPLPVHAAPVPDGPQVKPATYRVDDFEQAAQQKEGHGPSR